MFRFTRTLAALVVLLPGLLLIPFIGLPAQAVGWQRYAGIYEDVVTVTRARYDYTASLLYVEATSSSAEATLTVYETATNELIGTLVYQDGVYTGELAWPRFPQAITVRSSLGGESTVLVSYTDPPPTVTPPPTATTYTLYLPIVITAPEE